MFEYLLYILAYATVICFFPIHAANRNFYKILGVSRSAGEKEIKRAYRKLSLKYHPDKCKEDDCQEKFTDVNAAYDALSDAEKRKVYDRRGEEGLQKHQQQEQGGGGFDPFDMFFGGGGRRKKDKGAQKGEETKITIDVSLRMLYVGEVIEFDFDRDVLCGRWDECEIDDSGCSGPGVRTKTQRIGPGFMQQFQQQDDRCIAAGKRYNPNCRACPNGATVRESTPLTLDIEPGMKHGQEVRFEDVGDEKIGYSAGDLVVVLREVPHPYFTRDGDDLRMRLGIKLLDALVGFETKIEHVDGHEVTIKSDGVIDCNHVMRIKGEGMRKEHGDGLGDLVITFEIEYPKKKLNEKKRNALRKILS